MQRKVYSLHANIIGLHASFVHAYLYEITMPIRCIRTVGSNGAETGSPNHLVKALQPSFGKPIARFFKPLAEERALSTVGNWRGHSPGA